MAELTLPAEYNAVTRLDLLISQQPTQAGAQIGGKTGRPSVRRSLSCRRRRDRVVAKLGISNSSQNAQMPSCRPALIPNYSPAAELHKVRQSLQRRNVIAAENPGEIAHLEAAGATDSLPALCDGAYLASRIIVSENARLAELSAKLIDCLPRLQVAALMVPIKNRIMSLALFGRLAYLSAESQCQGQETSPASGAPTAEVSQHVFPDSQSFPGTHRDYWFYVPRQYDPAV